MHFPQAQNHDWSVQDQNRMCKIKVNTKCATPKADLQTKEKIELSIRALGVWRD